MRPMPAAGATGKATDGASRWPGLQPDQWPYPLWIAHRGAGRLAPENTLAAFRLGHAYGYRMFECDVRLSADGLPFLLHDDDLERTTSGHGPAAALEWSALSQLDAGSWHSARFCAEPLASLSEVMRFCQAADCALNVELKPAPGSERETGLIVAEALVREWRGALPPLLSSFSSAALEGARTGAAWLPRALLVEHADTACVGAAQALGCVAMVVEHGQIEPQFAATVSAAGLVLLSYTVNDELEVLRLLGLGVQGLITDRVDGFKPGS